MTALIVAYLGGVLTILSPCILPVLPFVFARARQPFVRSILPMLAGLALTFAAVGSLAAIGGGWAVHANQYGRYLALGLLAFWGVTLLWPGLAVILSQPIVALGARLAKSAGSALALGIATGLLWTPCAGPILGLILTGAALEGATAHTALLLLAYAAGAATSLAAALLAGGRLAAIMRGTFLSGERIRQALGIAVLSGVSAIALGVDTGLLARLSYAGTTRLEEAVLKDFAPDHGRQTTMVASNTSISVAQKPDFKSSLPVEGRLPSLDGAVEWLNSPPLTGEQLRGKVVLVDFWTYSCINCIRTLPYIRAWAEKYRDRGLVVIGVHAPEFAFEKKIDNVKGALRNFRIGYPVAIDNDYRIWRAFRNSYWPTLYFIDAQGQIRHHVFGEGEYDRSEQVIQDLLAEASGKESGHALVTPAASGAEAAPDLGNIRSGETYLGYGQAANFVSPEGLRGDVARDYEPGQPGLNAWGLSGNWTVASEQASLNKAGGGITYRFQARDLHLVLGPGSDGKPVRFQVTVDGKPPGPSHGSDTDADGYGTITETRLYQLVRQAGQVTKRTFEIRFLDPGVQAFAFTFG